MQPVSFEQSKSIKKTPAEICAGIADVAGWNDFDGWLFLPGIEKAEYETRTREMTGSLISVKNRDGSTHKEEILAWNPPENVIIKLYDFSPPLNRLATHFIEEWRFKEEGKSTCVSRKFDLFPKNAPARTLLWLISLFLRKAVAVHLDEIGKG